MCEVLHSEGVQAFHILRDKRILMQMRSWHRAFGLFNSKDASGFLFLRFVNLSERRIAWPTCLMKHNTVEKLKRMKGDFVYYVQLLATQPPQSVL